MNVCNLERIQRPQVALSGPGSVVAQACEKDCAADHRRDQEGVLRLGDYVMGEAEQRRDGAEGKPCGHQQRGVHRLATPVFELQSARESFASWLLPRREEG
jgi:hypothetical protein